MASYCPNCNYKLSLIDMKSECPVCGVNLMYFGMEERLKEEADKAEYEHAMLQPHLDRLKSANIGSPLSIVRLVVTFLPLIATLVPFGKLKLSLPFYHIDESVNIVTVVKRVFMDLDIGYYFDMIGDPRFGKAYLFEFIAIAGLVLALVFALVNVINLLAAGGPRGIRRNVTIASIGLAFSLCASVAYTLSVSAFNSAAPEVYSGKIVVWGMLALILMFAAVITVNVIYKKKGRPVKYTDVSQFLLSYDERNEST